jgi:outer membrane protein assembly factor BamA
VDSLRAVVATKATRCPFLLIPLCATFGIGREEHLLDLGTLAQDVVNLQLYHRDHGYYAAQVAPRVDAPPGEDDVAVEFAIAPGRQVILRSLSIVGGDSLLPPAEIEAAIPLKEGEPFGRFEFLASADTIRQRLLQQGYAYADVLRNYGIDTIAGSAEAEFVAIPGPLVFVDTIIIAGNERLSESDLRRQLTFREGGILRLADLNQSQRNLYNLDMVSFASLRIAPDTLQVEAAQEQATVLLELVENAQYAVETTLGFGTIECVRTSGRWINRNFIGRGRRLEISGSLSRVGVGAPTDLGFDGVCTTLGDEQGFFGLEDFVDKDRVDYSLSADLQQPNVLGTQNRLAINLHNERISEVNAYIRESMGGRVAAVRDLATGTTTLTTTFEANRGRTLASPAFLCVGFDTCSEEDIDQIASYRWSNSVSLAAVHDQTWTDGTTSRGFILRGGVDWAPQFASDDTYMRVLTEGSYYHPFRPGWVLALNARYGRFLSGILGEQGGYIPPERRFYGGGPSSVRGYTRNALGPTSYIQRGFGRDEVIVGSATGGTQMFIATAEVRLPSPIMRDIARAALFVDAGHVSAPGSELFSGGGVRFTPGVGLRFLTPVGPFRLDLAYNPYGRERGPLYILEDELLILADRRYRPPAPNFRERFRIQFGLGQAF